MTISKLLKTKWLAGLLCFLTWSLVFAIIYAQSPLYTSNQNQYFLHGFAHAGIGFLDRDWLATTIDPLPVFSFLVQLTIQLARNGFLFYLYYALLMGVYLASLSGIADILFDLKKSRARMLVFLVIFLGIHSALFHFLLSRVMGSERPFLLEGGVAGQRLLGQVFQPSTFGVFLLLSIYLFLKDRIALSLLCLAIAASFHSVYLLGSAMITTGYILQVIKEKKSLRASMSIGFLALLFVLPAFLYATFVFRPTSIEVTREVNEILVNFRNPQHALPAHWFDWSVVVQTVIVLIALYLARKSRLFPILAVVTAGTTLLTIIQVMTNSYTLALLYPWRTSVFLVPTSTTILLAASINWLMNRCQMDPEKLFKRLLVPSLFLLSLLVVVGIFRFEIEKTRQALDPALPIMEYARDHKTPNDVYLIPVKMESFRLVTGAPIYVDFKSVPYRDLDVLEWDRRFSLANLLQQKARCSALITLYEQGVTHVILPATFPATCPGLTKIYETGAYDLYTLEIQ